MPQTFLARADDMSAVCKTGKVAVITAKQLLRGGSSGDSVPRVGFARGFAPMVGFAGDSAPMRGFAVVGRVVYLFVFCALSPRTDVGHGLFLFWVDTLLVVFYYYDEAVAFLYWYNIKLI